MLSIGSAVSCCLRAERVGRDGNLELAFNFLEGRTILTRRRFTLPLQSLESGRNRDGSLYVMLLNPTGGLVGGDRLTASIRLGPRAHVIVSTPSASKVYRTLGDPAVANTTITLGENATLEYFPDHVVPHPGSVLHQSHRIEMAPGSRAIIYDGIAAGRVGRGETWQFRELASAINLSINGRPIYISRMKFVPSRQPLGGVGWFEGHNYAGSLLVVADSFGGWDALCTAMRAVIEAHPEACGGATPLAAAGCLARFMTPTATALSEIARTLWSAARRIVLGLAPFDLRKY